MAHSYEIKQKNKRDILTLLYRKKDLSKKRIAQELHLSASVITKLCGELEQDRLIQETKAIVTGKAGRREIKIAINQNAAYCIGVTINHHTTAIVLTDMALNPMKTSRLSIDPDGNRHILKIINCVSELIASAGISPSQLIGVGVSIKGLTDGEKSIHGIWNVPVAVRKPMEEALHIPVVMDNGIRCSALLEQMTSDEDNFIFIKYMQPGIGATFLKDGEIYRGESYFSMEIGHTIIDPEGDYCPLCRRRGCLESVISIDRMTKEITEQFSPEWCPELYGLCEGSAENISLELILKAADNGSIEINRLLKRNARYFAIAVINAHTLIDIHKIMIVGTLFSSVRFSEYFKTFIYEYQLTPIYDMIQILPLKNMELSPAALCVHSFLEHI
ncbi:N-acetylglucosamine repressor [Caprobacter fermentans]|uniref:N-acetylglucosamine repressor n=1 Tax=Caproicibacter fermentans TaxID=2576756 RepID=A0A6N8HYN9_9FIRM|nr:ROK family transcriptional regulator [Caproicibacter fermentans]MVB10715.1 N-acetylglucosamine repressor [Caproicibacter fermentans]OCN00478.1 hypothetical protein A7X67_16590 [Clostridium sp. W14A]